MFFPPPQQKSHPGRHYPPNDFMFPGRPPARAHSRAFPRSQFPADRINKGVEGLSRTLGNVEQVLKVVQSAAPIVQEYGPMVKNLPAMYRMMKAFKEVEETPEKPAEDSTKPLNQHTEAKDFSSKGDDITKTPEKRKRGDSTPRLFI
ncbi:VrrA/YqfQ family protein [Virgibacillus sediminis]|uniref:VrrA/YqfQ family protein n=1 Tax=Virgibacillus sediminis TaxID=202260 RepID=A0ABV7A5K8_9BACI